MRKIGGGRGERVCVCVCTSVFKYFIAKFPEFYTMY